MNPSLSFISFMALVLSVTQAFSPCSPEARSTFARSTVPSTFQKQSHPSYQPLNLHPDQAKELEAAASEIFFQASPLEEGHQDTVSHGNAQSSPLSAASSSSAGKPSQKWWSKTFVNLVGRGSAV
eukprot:CAMPEP_0197244352 /NCGR_PEP_ID=MMETSP1429-20130617/9500_1 /TAXON_ID=49237 /ORGANISM="Chaetoceros  sp., Strain UNC1202" /LENGTH=124 /DNA_ID=CAMNT_0042704699 /DNA_START=18 /DNA_END=392 /DNA_ORIENTATION=+